LFVKCLRSDANEQQVVDMVRPFRPVKVVVFHLRGRALVEFADDASCVGAMNYLNTSAGLGEGGGRVHAERSNTGAIRDGQGLVVGPDGAVQHEGAQRVNQRMVKICCKGSTYAVNAAAVHAAVLPYGAPCRIATYKSFDDAVNALVEFDTAADAANVVKSLDGQFLYAGRVGLMKCSLSHQTEVIIKETSSDRNWDRAVSPTPAAKGQPHYQQGAPGAPAVAAVAPAAPAAAALAGGGAAPIYGGGYHQYGAYYPPPASGAPPTAGAAASGGSYAEQTPQTCMTVSNADWSVTRLEHVFNLFGYFGNVARVKLLPQKNLCLVDFATPEEAQNAMRFVRGLVLFKQHLHVCFSKYPTLNVAPGTFTDQARDYTQMPRLHRYPQGIASDRVKWIVAPTARLHVILTGRAPAVLEQDLRPLFERTGPVLSFAAEHNSKADGVKVAMALVEIASPEDATNVLATWHNYEMQNGSKLFLSFTTKRLRDRERA
jgi:hnRNP-L/PTB/hephaestus splicing factor